MIHDLDIVLAFAQSPIRELHAVGIPILSDKVDIANVRIEFESGCVANLTASRVSTERVRKLRFFQPHQYISLDYARQDVFAISVDPAAMASDTPPSAANLPGTAGLPMPGMSLQRPQVEAEEPLRAELKSFLEAVRDRSKPLVTLEEGRRALSVALDIVRAMAEHHRRANLEKVARLRS